ncbi:MAG: SDR family NAD(P)-dependent oxidoreductase [Kordiimonas sp.]
MKPNTQNYDFTNRTAVITGGASGIGREVATQMAHAGANVVIADISHDRKKVAHSVNETNARQDNKAAALAAEVDVSDPTSVENMIATAEQHFKQIDILVHCAGIGIEKPFLETSIDEWNRIIDIDLTGTFLCCRAAARAMLKNNHGRIITLSSTAGVRGGYNRAAYGAAKGGVVSLTKVMAVELAPYNITVNSIAPGAIETELVSKMHTARTRQIYTDAIPAGRYGTPFETAAAALFLASDEASYVNGHTLAVDGGFLGAGLTKKSVNAVEM